jgi:transposase
MKHIILRRMSTMTEKSKNQAKINILKKRGTLNPKPEKVKDSLFASHEFFDPDDLIQVKYEMLRRVEKESMPITKASSSFGYSRFSFYRILTAFKNKGISGLIPEKKGPSGGYKLSEGIMDFVEAEMKKDNTLKSPKLKKVIEKRFGITIHKRSIERAIARRKKNQPSR